MKIIDQSYEILSPMASCGEHGCELPNAGFIREARLIEQAGRTAYRSGDRTTDTSYDSFIRGIIKRKHDAVIEFGTMMVKFITNRGVSHELVMVRHRLCSFVQEFTRYCNYGQDKFDNEITFIRPSTWDSWEFRQQEEWKMFMMDAETRYMNFIGKARMSDVPLSPQQARGVLPNDLKTEICVRADFREWRQIFRLRCTSSAHPDMQAAMLPLRDECIRLLPCVFTDLKEESNG
jgi:thymidylate synthase (FAD)